MKFVGNFFMICAKKIAKTADFEREIHYGGIFHFETC